MLKEITIKNFTSFNEETTFSMEADTERVSEHPDHVVNVNGNNLLKVASVYGPNGGGKTNLIKALKVPFYLISSFNYQNADKPCIFTGSDEIEETLFFVNKKFEIGYHFKLKYVERIDSIKRTEFGDRESVEEQILPSAYYRIIEENIVYRRSKEQEFISLCSRNQDGVIIGDDFTSLFEKNVKLSNRMSIVRYVYELFADNDSVQPEQFEVIKYLYREIDSVVSLDFNIDRFSMSLSFFAKTIKKYERELTALLNSLDINIARIKVYEGRRNTVMFTRKININGKGIEKDLPLSAESKGTQKIFGILIRIIDNIEKGKIFYCDDMNAYLHPKLFRTIVELFQTNVTGSQLIFNSHDILNMDNDLFRRDEIWFAYRDDSYSTKLVPLSNIVNYKGEQVRKDAKYYKQYLEGKYGADPFIAKGLNWNEKF